MAVVTLSHLWSLLLVLPLAAQSAVVLALVLLGVGVAAVSLGAGRAAGWAQQRRVVPRAVRLVRSRREWRVRVARRGPQRLIDRRARVLLASLESGAGDTEAAR